MREEKMKTNDKILEVIRLLKKEYPVANCSLVYHSPLQLLIAARLSAQCTDKKVNSVTNELFSKFKCAEDFAQADLNEIVRIIKPCGLYKIKSQNIIDMCKKILSDYNGTVPHTMQDLTSLPGIGRKTANLVLSEVYNKPGIIVDTHFSRITNRIGFHKLKDPIKIEFLMRDIVPIEESVGFCHRIVMHGREICKARNPLCNKCIINHLCDYFLK